MHAEKGELAIRAVSPATKDDVLGFFDRDAFADNPEWADCYCMFYHFEGSAEEWDTQTADQNRAAMAARIGAGNMAGQLAYIDGKLVGWCNAAPRPSMSGVGMPQPSITGIGIPQVEGLSGVRDARVGSIVCFVIAAPYRGQGIARALLDAACESFLLQGLEVAEAYPRKEVSSAAEAYHGPLTLYQQAGFEEHQAAADFIVMRKQLNG